MNYLCKAAKLHAEEHRSGAQVGKLVQAVGIGLQELLLVGRRWVTTASLIGLARELSGFEWPSAPFDS